MKSKYFREYFCSFSSKSYYFYILGVSHLKTEILAFVESLAVPDLVVLRTFVPANVETFVKITFPFQWNEAWCAHCSAGIERSCKTCHDRLKYSCHRLKVNDLVYALCEVIGSTCTKDEIISIGPTKKLFKSLSQKSLEILLAAREPYLATGLMS